MAFYHLIFDLFYFGTGTLLYTENIFILINYGSLPIAGCFIFLAGVNAYHGHSREKIDTKKMHRLLRLLGAAFLVSLGTNLFFSDGWVRFGILHFIFTATLLNQTIFHKMPRQALTGLSLCIALIHFVLMSLDYEPSGFLAHVIVMYGDIYALDHVPLVPWLSIYLVGKISREYIFSLTRPKTNDFAITLEKWIGALGKHSLLFYLIHQPLILSFLWLLGAIVL
tara:strand:+ start:1096 stop:1767 length:672 start_codon:yes stop_codon:yes gene_type:complete